MDLSRYEIHQAIDKEKNGDTLFVTIVYCLNRLKKLNLTHTLRAATTMSLESERENSAKN